MKLWFKRDWNANNPADPMEILNETGAQMSLFVIFPNLEGIQLAARLCENGNLQQLRSWLDSNSLPPTELSLLLFVACTSDQKEIAEFLIDPKGVDPNKADQEGFTPLWVACERKRLEIVNYTFSLVCGCLEVAKFLVSHPRVDTKISIERRFSWCGGGSRWPPGDSGVSFRRPEVRLQLLRPRRKNRIGRGYSLRASAMR